MTIPKYRLDGPCPSCGTVVYFDAEEYRITVPCHNCGARVQVPHGSVVTEDAIGMDPSRDISDRTGFLTQKQFEELYLRNARESIRRWEDVVRSQSSPEVCREAKDEVFRAISYLGIGKKWFNFNGNRYTLILKGRDIRVSPIPPKRTRKRDL
jgi:endogenous inhibitor of DNA gyrase (YacG/DUF329 family)